MSTCGATGGLHVCELAPGHPPPHRQTIVNDSRTSWTFDERPVVPPASAEQLSIFAVEAHSTSEER